MDQETNSLVFHFRPRVEEEGHWRMLRQVCSERKISMSALFNAMLLPLASELARQQKNSDKTYTLDLGSITLE